MAVLDFLPLPLTTGIFYLFFYLHCLNIFNVIISFSHSNFFSLETGNLELPSNLFLTDMKNETHPVKGGIQVNDYLCYNW